MSEEKAVEKRYCRTVSSLLQEAMIYRRKCSRCKGTGVVERKVVIGEAICCSPHACPRCEGDGYRYSMDRKKQSPSFARVTVTSMAKRSIVPYLNSLKPSVVKLVQEKIEKEIDEITESFEWVARAPGGRQSPPRR